ncbi:hypothetical protein MTF66_19610 [Pseudoalteromonas sp. 2CM39R]|uniref:hypothetical protein n=1 Tax=Pseudoalteromonas sp. 2CM39R TaxID=2929856 RepID=UPI0020BF6095|nr:hypothetical protein [Pseudoalteromonas sp. 2CM39R]MCK8127229.1 hypothetical protein [Pseudoalteromonas sp. 2CM39R]
MTELFIIAIVVCFVLLVISTLYTMKNRYFENQVRNLSEVYTRLSIEVKKEKDLDKALAIHAKAEEVKDKIELLIGKYPKMERVSVELPADRKEEPLQEMGLGELMRHYSEKNNSSVIYAKFNREDKDS